MKRSFAHAGDWRCVSARTKLWRRLEGAVSYDPQNQPSAAGLAETTTIPELQQSKTAMLSTLASTHSRRSYAHTIERFIAWYCSEPRLEFNRSVVVKYRSFLEHASLSAVTINLHHSAIGGSSMNLPRPVGSTRNWQLASGELREPIGSDERWVTGSLATRLKNSECCFQNQFAGLERWSNGRITVGMWAATLVSCGLEPRSVAIERRSLGHCQFSDALYRAGRVAT